MNILEYPWEKSIMGDSYKSNQFQNNEKKFCLYFFFYQINHLSTYNEVKINGFYFAFAILKVQHK